MLLLEKWTRISTKVLLSQYLDKTDPSLPVEMGLALPTEKWNGELIVSSQYAYIKLLNSQGGVVRQEECDTAQVAKIKDYIRTINEQIVKDVSLVVEDWLADSIDLEGTPKQIEWAKTIRTEAFHRLVVDSMRPREGMYSAPFFDHLAGQKRLETIIKNQMLELKASLTTRHWKTEEGKQYCQDLYDQYVAQYGCQIDSALATKETPEQRKQVQEQLTKAIGAQLRRLSSAKWWIEARYSELGAPLLWAMTQILLPKVDIPKEIEPLLQKK